MMYLPQTLTGRCEIYHEGSIQFDTLDNAWGRTTKHISSKYRCDGGDKLSNKKVSVSFSLNIGRGLTPPRWATPLATADTHGAWYQ